MGDGLAPLLLYTLSSYAIVFFIGFTVVSSAFLLAKPRAWDLPFFLRIGLFSILGGFLAIQLIFLWQKVEARLLYARKEAFAEKMEQEYPVEIAYQPDTLYYQQFKVLFSVPVSTSYSLAVYGFPARPQKFSPSLDKAIITFIKYDLPLKAGRNELVVGFADYNNWLQTRPSIDFIVVIKPLESREKLGDRAELTEGINYYSSNMNAFADSSACINDFYRPVACVASDQLHINAWK